MSLRIFVFEEDASYRKLLTIYLERLGHQVRSFTEEFSCPLYQNAACQCPADTPCADAVLVSLRPTELHKINILIDQNAKGCKLTNANKAVLSTAFPQPFAQTIEEHGFLGLRKPSRLKQIEDWLRACAERLSC